MKLRIPATLAILLLSFPAWAETLTEEKSAAAGGPPDQRLQQEGTW